MERSRRKRMHLSRFNYIGSSHVYFITICTAHKRPFFEDAGIAGIIADEMEFRRKKKEIILFCFCIMPDHVHMLLSLAQAYRKSLINWVSAFKRSSSRIAKRSHSIESLWQKNFYDHVVRKHESLIKVAEYIVNNPVRKGMVGEWKEYPYSRILDPLPM
jgi:putative transposase